jgi:hypothetical protein
MNNLEIIVLLLVLSIVLNVCCTILGYFLSGRLSRLKAEVLSFKTIAKIRNKEIRTRIFKAGEAGANLRIYTNKNLEALEKNMLTTIKSSTTHIEKELQKVADTALANDKITAAYSRKEIGRSAAVALKNSETNQESISDLQDTTKDSVLAQLKVRDAAILSMAEDLDVICKKVGLSVVDGRVVDNKTTSKKRKADRK